MQTERLELIEPVVELRGEYESYCREFAGRGEIPGNASMHTRDDFEQAVRASRDYARGVDLPQGWVPGDTFWLVRDGRRLVGMINFRHELTDFLHAEGGHVGYSVRPSEQGRGYATHMLQRVLGRARELGLRRVLITCDERNAASARVIEKCGGILENSVPSAVEGREVTCRYWIDL